ncbi:hypothetical protein ABZ820_34710 [Streptomyces diacarni]|uniref:hypothetical protein n=1 Tax=Streptomyces diacarni TaxID=2800381 RepID=UPI0034110868
MVEPERLITPEIAERYGVSLHTVRKSWMQRPDWPAPAGKRGRYQDYDAAAVAEWVRVHAEREPVTLEPKRLYTAVQLEEAGVGIKAGTIRADRSRGRWPAPDDTEGGVNRWYGSTVSKVLAERQAYRRAE